jgi:hypothetical protein
MLGAEIGSPAAGSAKEFFPVSVVSIPLYHVNHNSS